LLAGAFVAVVAAGWLVLPNPQATVIVRNSSGVKLRNLVVSGRGFKVTCPNLQPGETANLPVRLSEDTGIAVAFEALGRQYSSPEQEYAGAGGYRITVEVGSDFSVSVHSELVA